MSDAGDQVVSYGGGDPFRYLRALKGHAQRTSVQPRSWLAGCRRVLYKAGYKDKAAQMDAHTGSTTGSSAARPLNHRETRLVIAGVLVPLFMGSLDNTILASALPTIGRGFGDVAGTGHAGHRLLSAASAARRSR